LHVRSYLDKNLELSQNSKVWHCDIWKYHKMSFFIKSLVQNFVYILRLDFARNDFNINFFDGRIVVP